MAATTPAPEVAAMPASTTKAWLALALAPCIALGMTAVASCAVAVLAIPVAFVLTRDGYVALLAVSYGPYAAAQVLVSVAVATTILSLVWQFGRGRAVWATGGGVLAGMLGLALAPVFTLGWFAQAWHYGPALPLTLGNVLVAALAGGLAASIHPRFPAPRAAMPAWRAALWRMGAEVAVFALALALLLEGWVASTALLG